MLLENRRFDRRKSQLCFLLAAGFIFLFLFACSSTALAQPAVSVACSPCYGNVGTTVTVQLTGWGPMWGAQLIGQTTTFSVPGGCIADSTGACSTQIQLATPGTYTFSVQGEFGSATASQTFNVLSPVMSMTPTCGAAGTSVTVSGQNFWSSYPYNIDYGTSFIQLGVGTTDSAGNFSQAVTIPGGNSPATITVTSGPGGGGLGSLTFTAPSCGQIGTVTELAGIVTQNGQPLSTNSPITLDGTIATGPNAQVMITLSDNTQLTLPQNSQVKLDEYVYSPSATPNGSFLWEVVQGAIFYGSGLINPNPTLPDNKEIRGSWWYAGIRGTQFIAWPGTVPNSTEFDLISGTLALTPSQSGSATVFTGPLTIVISASGTSTAPLTQAQYNTIANNLLPPPSMDTAPPVVSVTFPAPPSTQAGFFNASQVPVQGSVSATDHSNVTAINCSDSLGGGLVTGNLTGGGTTTASSSLSVTGKGSNSINCTATDGVNNIGAASGSTNTATVTIDATPPTISGVASPAANANGWNNTNVTVTFTCADASSGVASCPAATTLSTEGASQSVTGTATDKAGNSTQTTVSGINIDKTSPTVTYSGNAGTYTAAQTVAISCTAADALSGIASTTCANISGLASSFGAGTHSYSATATDRAGNTGSGSTSFTVSASSSITFQGLIHLVDSWVTAPLLKAEMDITLLAADTAFAVKDTKLGDSLLGDFIQEITAQYGKSLTAAHAAQLIQDAQSLER
jgi:hypothetical protein